MKKFRVLLVMMIAVVFSLTGCGPESALKYEIDQQSLIDDAKATLEYMLNLTDSGKKYTVAQGEEPYASAVAGLMTTNEEAGAFVSLKETKFTQGKNDIEIVLVCEFEKTDVEVLLVYEANDAYEYRDVYQNAEGILPYSPTEITVQAIYPMSYYLKQGASNTLLGMGTVFIVLIFISFIISFFQYIPMAIDKSEKKKIAKVNARARAEIEKTLPQETAPAAPAVPDTRGNLMDDSELAAVITAAIYAASAEGGGCASKDTLIVRSISRARR